MNPKKTNLICHNCNNNFEAVRKNSVCCSKICKIAINAGYNFLVIWEQDYKNNPKGTIKKCINFLTQ